MKVYSTALTQQEPYEFDWSQSFVVSMLMIANNFTGFDKNERLLRMNGGIAFQEEGRIRELIVLGKTIDWKFATDYISEKTL